MTKCKSLMVLLAMAIATTPMMAAEFDVSAGADIFDKYIWRGQTIGTKSVIQPSATIGASGYSVNVWGSMPMDKNDGSGKPWAFQELDYTFDYSGSYEAFSYSAGFIIYTFPVPNGNTANSTYHEIYGSLGYDTFLSPAITLYKGTYTATGWYINASCGHSLDLTEELALDLGASLGWSDNQYNKAYWSSAPAGLNDLVLSAALPLAAGPVSVVPSLSYVSIVDSKIRQVNSNRNDNWILGIGASYEF